MGIALLPVVVLTIGIGVGGVLLIARESSWFLRTVGVVLLAFAGLVVPRPPRMPRHVAELSRESAPQTWKLVEELAGHLGAPVPTALLVTKTFNAFVTPVGWRWRPVLVIGAPFWAGLTPQTRVALLSHELGHLAHRDLRKGRVPFVVQNALLGWYSAVVSGSRRASLERVVLAPARGLIAANLAMIAWLGAPGRQRQEFFADVASARMGGTPAALRLLDLLLWSSRIEAAITRTAIASSPSTVGDIMWATVAADLADVSEESYERRRISEEAARSRMDASHPSTVLRIRLLQQVETYEPTVEVTADRDAAIAGEWAPAMEEAARACREGVRYQR